VGYTTAQLKGYMSARFGEGDWVLNVSNEQVFLNEKLIRDKDLDLEDIEDELAIFLLRFRGIKEVYTATAMQKTDFSSGRASSLQNGYNFKSSGNLLLILEPGWLTGGAKGTSHGTGFTYDTHVPILFYGWNVKAGSSTRYTTITDIAPTLSMMLGIRLPNGATGQPIQEITN
jgi:hypothetical protein